MRRRTKCFPLGVVNPTGPISNTAKGYHLSWLVQILPFLEQRNAFNKTNFSMGAYDDANATVSNARHPQPPLPVRFQQRVESIERRHRLRRMPP